jgi:predicted ATPase/DNA-binding SARP family transcriptional activator
MTRLSIRMLGQLQVTVDGNSVTSFESDKVRALLVYITVEAERLHRREALASLLWPERPEGSALNNLRGALSNLRKTIQDHSAEPQFLNTTRQTIQFNAESDHWFDVSKLSSLKGQDALSTSPTSVLEEAASCYQGSFLEGFTVRDSAAFEEWAMFKREELSRLISRILQELVARHERGGDLELALSYAWRWVELDSLDETAHRQVMRLLASSGQRSNAIAQYEVLRRILADELGVEPSEETQSVFRALMDEETVQPPIKSVEGGKAPPAVELPFQMTPFIGRKRELEQIGKLLVDITCRLITLTGPGGVGKTRLAIQAAEAQAMRFSDGVCFVPLEPLTSADFLVSATATALKFAYSGPGDPKRQLLNYLQETEALLVLDNFEHLLDGIGLISEMLEKAPLLKVMVTSRERLNLHGEWILEVGSMDFPDDGVNQGIEAFDAVQLFLSCANRALPAYSLTKDELPYVVRICQLMEGMPLGIELSAAWLRTLSTQQIVSEIEGGLEFLSSSLRDIPERHRSLWAVFDHSWKLLSPEEQSAFRRLSVFRGGFDRDAAENVAGATLPILSALVDKSLVRRIDTARYEIHGLLQQYARSQRVDSGEFKVIRTRHRDWFLSLAEEVSGQLKDDLWGTAEAESMEKLKVERDNFRIALQWSIDQEDANEGLGLVVALSWFWYIRADFAEGRHWLEQILELEDGTSAEARALAVHRLATMTIMQGDYERGVVFAEEALQVCYEAGTLREAGWTLYQLGLAAMQQGDFEEAEMFCTQSLDLFRQIGYPVGEASLQVYLGTVAYYQQNYERASTLFEQGLPLLREVGDHIAVARGLNGLGLIAHQVNDFELAKSYFEEGILLMVEIDARLEVAQLIEGLATVSCNMGNYPRSCIMLGFAEHLRDTIGIPLSTPEQAEYDHCMSTIREKLQDEVIADCWAKGQEMKMDEAVAWVINGVAE